MNAKALRGLACAGTMVFVLARGALAAPAEALRPTAVGAQAPHALAVAALRDLRVAVAQIVAAESATSSGPAEYLRDAQRAINALVGVHGEGYAAEPGAEADADGVLGRLDTLLDRADTPPWVPAVHGVQANVRAAVGHLDDALQARGLGAFEVDVSKALLNLQVAIGRSSEPDVLGGLLGAMSSTELGVPAGAPRLDACAAPRRVGYGMHGGYWVWRAVPVPAGTQALALAGASRMRRQGDMLVLETPAASLPQARCMAPQARVDRLMDDARPAPRVSLAVWHAQTLPHARLLRVALKTGGHDAVHGGGSAAAMPQFTQAQARAGQPVYDKFCASCHGDQLQGVAAPALVGHDFLSTAQHNGWTVGVLRTIVTQNMPFNDPGSLDAKQYADVMAFLLAANCYAPGNTPFPLHHVDALDHQRLPDPPAGAHADAHGVCAP